jgi:ERCC4-type nuclease
MRLLADDRERKIIPYFSLLKNIPNNIEIEIKRIYAGDYAIYDGEDLVIVIERKSIKDLAASMTDGRKTNIDNLVEARDKTGCKIVYLIEGKARYAENHKIGRIPYKNLQAHLDHIMIRDGILIIYSSSYEDSAVRIIEFIKNYISLGLLSRYKKEKIKEMGDEEEKVCLETQIDQFDVTEKKITPDSKIIYQIWTSIPCVTDNNVSLFVEQYHISDLILGNISYDTIYSMKYPSGAIIGKRADKIIHVCESTQKSIKIYYEMLACIHGLTKKTAAIILSKYNFHEILRGNITNEQLRDIQKTEKSKLGKKIATDILRFFNKQDIIN